MAEPLVLFVCTGNYYRSRFAEAVFDHHRRRLGLQWRVDSRGLSVGHPGNVGPISRHAQTLLETLGIPYDLHRFPRALTETDLQSAARIIAVDRDEHEPMFQVLFPEWIARVEFWDVEDIDRTPPDRALPRLIQRVEALLGALEPVR